MNRTTQFLLVVISVCALASVACNSGADAATAESAAEEPAADESAGTTDEEGSAEVVAQAAEPESQPATEADGPHLHDPAGMENVLAEGEYSAGDLVAQPGASVGDMTTCLVSGEAFRVTEDSPYFDHEGARVYFCCASCIRRFQRDPTSYLAGAATVGGQVEIAPEGTRFDPAVEKSQIPDGAWICDMGTVHYAAHEAGSCPICGMHLTQL